MGASVLGRSATVGASVAMVGLCGAAAAWLLQLRADPAAAEGKEDSAHAKLTSHFTYYSGLHLAEPDSVKIFSGTAHPVLARDIAKYLGVTLGKMQVSRFADGEVAIKVQENVRGKHVVIVQSTRPPSVNDALVELLLMVSTMRRSSAKTITVVMPYCAYSRSDLKQHARSPIAARDVMQMLQTVGMDRLISVDLHSGQMQGFLPPSVPSDNMTAIKVGALFFSEMESLRGQSGSGGNLVVVSPSEKSVGRAKEFWNVMLRKGKPDARFALVLRKPALESKARKMRDKDAAAAAKASLDASPQEQQQQQGELEHEVVGEAGAIDGCDAIIVQDIVDSGFSMCNAAAALKASGARRVFGFATHGLFSNDALERIEASALDGIVVCNTASDEDAPDLEGKPKGKITWISLAPLLAETVRRVCEHEPLSPLYAMPGEQDQAT